MSLHLTAMHSKASCDAQRLPIYSSWMQRRLLRLKMHSQSQDVASPGDGVRQFYRGWNQRDLELCMDAIAEDCVYEDTVFADPFIGREKIRQYFVEILEFLDPEVQFIVDDASVDPNGGVGLLWHGLFGHVEVANVEIPFSKGCSFLRVNDDGKIIFARDVVEPTIKPGHNAMKLMTLVVPIMKKLGPKASPSNLRKIPVASIIVWILYAYYVWTAFLDPNSPGAPVWQTSTETLQRVVHESLNFFYVNIFLHQIFPSIPSIPEHPVDEAIFNFVGAWGLLFLPVMLADKRTTKMQPTTKWGLWIGTWFLTNVFFIPYHAIRLLPDLQPQEEVHSNPKLPQWAPIVGVVGGLIGVISILWAIYGRPEYGDIADRLNFYVTETQSNRVSTKTTLSY